MIEDILTLLRLGNTSLRTTEKFVLLVLADHAGPDGRCSPSETRIASLVESSERTVRRAIERLEELGLVEVERRPGQNSTYRLRLDRMGFPAERRR